MERRDFIRSLLPKDLWRFLTGSLLVLALFLLLINASGIIENTTSIVQLAALALGFVVGFLLIAIIVRYLLLQLFNLLPAGVRAYLIKHQTTIANVLLGLVACYVVYDLILDKEYFLLIFLLVYSVWNYIDRKQAKSE